MRAIGIPGLVLVVGAAVACATPHSRVDSGVAGDSDIRQHLMNADRVFARAVADSGAPAWFARFAPDISKPGKAGLSLIHGSSAVTENDRAIFADASELLTWDPTDATVYNDRASGVTVGRYAVVRRSARADTLAHGHYLTQWRRQPDGSWKIQLDVGWVDK